MQIATLCGMGFGTSMMLALNIRKVLKEESITAKVDPIDLGSFKSMQADIVVAPRDMERQVRGAKARVVLIDNLIDKEEIRTKVLAAINDEESS